MRTARVTVLMTPGEKQALEQDAGQLGVSSGEYIRLAVDGFAETAEMKEARELAAELAEAMPAMLADFDAINGSIGEARAAIDAALRHTGARR
jgi:hypothetical protein